MKQYNTTQLHPEREFEKHIFHRDQFAHYLRWTHVLKQMKVGYNILDWGCGNGNLAEVIYRNKYKAGTYTGIDIRIQTIAANKEKFANIDWVQFFCDDLVNPAIEYIPKVGMWDLICSFEVLEHIGKQNAQNFINNIKKHMSNHTLLLISTPIYDPNTGAAENHIINGEIGEFTFNEMKTLLESNGFVIIDKFGTFASQKDYKLLMNEWQKNMFEHLAKYYDSNLVSNLMAPFFPEQSRNCLWVCKLNSGGHINEN